MKSYWKKRFISAFNGKASQPFDILHGWNWIIAIIFANQHFAIASMVDFKLSVQSVVCKLIGIRPLFNCLASMQIWKLHCDLNAPQRMAWNRGASWMNLKFWNWHFREQSWPKQTKGHLKILLILSTIWWNLAFVYKMKIHTMLRAI